MNMAVQGTGQCPAEKPRLARSLRKMGRTLTCPICTRKIDVSCGLQVAHTSYDNDDDNDKRNLQPATRVALHD